MDLAPKAPPYSHRRDLILSGDHKDLEKYLSGLLQELRARDDDLSLALSLETVGGVEGDLTDFFYTETEVDTWRSGVTQTEMGYLDGITSDIQTQLDVRCLESVFGTSIGTGLLLDGTVLKASTILQKYHGIDPSANVQTMLGSADNAAIASNIGLGTEDSPTFTDLTLSGLTASQAVLTDGSKKLISRAIGIADTNILRVDGTANSGEHAVFASSGLAGLTDTELIDGLSGDITGSQSFDWNMAWMDNVQRLRGCDDHHLNLYANYLATAGTEKDIIFWTLDEGNNTWIEVFRCDANGAAPLLKMAKVLNMNSQKLTTLPAPNASGEAIRQTANITEANLETLTDTSDADALHAHDTYCLESVLGTSIGAGLLLDGAVLKASAILQKYHGIDPSADVQSLLGCADEAAIRTLLDLEAGTDFYNTASTFAIAATLGTL